MLSNRHLFSNEGSKVAYATSFLYRPAFDQFKVYLNDYLKHKNTSREVLTSTNTTMKEIFTNYLVFRSKIKDIYRDLKAQKTTVIELRRLKQTGSIKDYTAKF